MAYQIVNGYSGILRPPVNHLDRRGCSMYCITTDAKKTLIAIPTVPSFYLDLYQIIANPQYQKLILVVPSTDCVWISDIYNLFGNVRYTLNKEMNVICPEKIQISTSDAFLDHVIARRHTSLAMMANDKEQFTVQIDFSSMEMPRGRDIWDVIVTCPNTKIYFCNYMTIEKCAYLKQNLDLYYEIHMPFINRAYGGLGYLDLGKEACGTMMQKMIVNGLNSDEELKYCVGFGIPMGEVKYRDFV